MDETEGDSNLIEEFEVLQSIYPEEFQKLSSRKVQISCSSEEGPDNGCILFQIEYPEEYPNCVPIMRLLPAVQAEANFDNNEEGTLIQQIHMDDHEKSQIIQSLVDIANESLGDSYTFSLVSALPSLLSTLLADRRQMIKAAKDAKDAADIEAELARTRGTAVTPASFAEWRKGFDKEMSQLAIQEEEERLAKLSTKEREEERKRKSRKSGKEIFSKDTAKTLDDDLFGEGDDGVDVHSFQALGLSERPDSNEDADEQLARFSDSD